MLTLFAVLKYIYYTHREESMASPTALKTLPETRVRVTRTRCNAIQFFSGAYTIFDFVIFTYTVNQSVTRKFT